MTTKTAPTATLNTTDHWTWIQDLIAQAEGTDTPAPAPAAVRPVDASRNADGSFRTDSNVISMELDADGFAVVKLRHNVAA